jgi:hypothetical protein
MSWNNEKVRAATFYWCCMERTCLFKYIIRKPSHSVQYNDTNVCYAILYWMIHILEMNHISLSRKNYALFRCICTVTKKHLLALVWCYICSSVSMHQCNFQWMNFHWIWYFEKTQFWLKSNKNISHLTWWPKYILFLSATYSLQKRFFVAVNKMFILLTVTCSSVIDRTYCHISTTTVVNSNASQYYIICTLPKLFITAEELK